MQISNLTIFLNTLLTIHPASGVLLVGAGNGRSEFVEWLVKNNISSATLIEPQDTAFKQLEAYIQSLALAEHQQWSLLKEVLAEQPGLVDFYYASKSTESGLTPPEQLNYIWPNLALLQTEILNATSLNDPYFNLALTHNWLMIDCIAALKVIGQPQNLAHVDVAIIKVLFNAENAAETSSDYNAITAFFNAYGFNEKLIHTGIHPDIGHVVYVRDYQAQFNTLKQELRALTTAHEQALTQYQADKEAWHEANQKSKAESQQQVELITQQQSQIQQLQQQLSGLKTTHEKIVTQLKELELKNQASMARENKLQTRYELMCKEIERAETQLNLIKEMGL